MGLLLRGDGMHLLINLGFSRRFRLFNYTVRGD